MSLKGKHIVLGITGGIAAYKSATLARLLVKRGAEVQVVMTPAAKEFITPLTLSTLTDNAVVSEFFNERTGEWHSHVDLGVWADVMLIAPATAATMAKMVTGLADNILVTTYLSCRATTIVAPAMDLDMYAHPSTQSNMALLKERGTLIIEPEEGELASHLVGKGRMAEPETIVRFVERLFADEITAPCEQPLKGQEVLITSGPTYERIDPVRFIGNYSTGKMGLHLAEVAASYGAHVTFVSGPVSQLPQGEGIEVISVESAREMAEACQAHHSTYTIGIMCAAVADYRPESCEAHKIKREKREEVALRLVRNPDIAATLGASKQDGQYLVGFALETDPILSEVQSKMRRKGLDMIILNSLTDKGAGFGTETNKISIITSGGDVTTYPLKSKREVAVDILQQIILHLRENE